MSKKKGKTAPKKAAKKTSKAAARPRATIASSGGGRTVQATIFIYRTGSGNRIRTSPHRLFANLGDRIAWSVVNLVDGSEVPVTITWPDGGPWGKEPITFRNFERKPVTVSKGHFKYVVSALDAVEDPEIEIPDV
jgi:hypothetical protein